MCPYACMHARKLLLQSPLLTGPGPCCCVCPVAGGAPFSAVVAEAKALGYTEPDPRDDLAGMDVARKVTILARCAHIAHRSC
jgi:hypothetical protein